MAKGTTCGATEVYIKATGTSTKYRATVLTNGQTAVSTQASGMKTKCTVMAFTLGLMDVVMKECTKMI